MAKSGKETPKENKRSNSLGKGKSAPFSDLNPAFAVGFRKPGGTFKDPPVVDLNRVASESFGGKRKKK